MWAIGVIAYFLLCGYTPFEGENSIEEMNAITRADYHFHEEYWSEVSDKGIIAITANGTYAVEY